MYFRVRNIAGKAAQQEIIVNISKMGKIEELKTIIFKKMKVEISKQVLLYKGKQLIDGHRIIDYGVQLNHVIQLIVRSASVPEQANTSKLIDKNEVNSTDNEEAAQGTSIERTFTKYNCEYYKVNDLVDTIDTEYGAWFEGKVVDILKEVTEGSEENAVIYKVLMERGEINDIKEFNFEEIRPRSYHTFQKSELKVGMTVLASYNIEDPKIRGYWYDMEITEISAKTVTGTVFFGNDRAPILNCKIKFVGELMRIESVKDKRRERTKVRPLRKQPYNCNKCKDIPAKKCKNCGCTVCGGKENPNSIILCDECDSGFHLACLSPPLSEVPIDPEWYCPECKNDENEIIKAGDKLRFSKKKAKMACNKKSSRDWGSGMACVGPTKKCTIIPKNHYGPVPGVEVGTCWRYRVQVSEVGVHRPPVGGIHGRGGDGGYSLVLSGGYEDDVDNGQEFYYTGSGGRNLTGNKRVSGQSSDQKLTKNNKALALNCNAKFNDKTGAASSDWKKGKPVRVVRNYKLAKYSKYAPKEGYRYDGIYKVVKYYPEKGKSGFIVWKYLLRRDDKTPAPWLKKGPKFEMVYPDNYLEAQKAKVNKKSKKTTSKKKLSDVQETPSKKPKIQEYKLSKNITALVKDDLKNEKFWTECKETLKEGKKNFLDKVSEIFMCICCQELVCQPITTNCNHNFCKSCLSRSFKSKIFTCPHCRFDLGKNYEMKVNENLSTALKELFPGYEGGR